MTQLHGAARLRGIVSYWDRISGGTEKVRRAKSDIAFMAECLRLAEIHVNKLSAVMKMMDADITAMKAEFADKSSGE